MWQVAVAVFAVGVAGHGWMNEPPSRAGATLEAAGTCPYGSCLWFNQGCTIGCPKCGGTKGSPTCGQDQGKATIPRAARTYWNGNPLSTCGTNPWCAPGSSPMMNPCGIAGGDVVEGKPGNGGDPPPGYKQGFRGDDMQELQGARWKRTYKAGDVVDMAWSVVANHGGGYQYRLCPKTANLTEECFQKTPLEFVGDEQYIQYVKYAPNPAFKPTDTPATFPPEKAFPTPIDLTNRTAIPAVRVSTGTLPAGSTWTRNPIPACDAAAGGAFNIKCGKNRGHGASDYQFPPAGLDGNRPGFLLGGFGGGSCGGCSQAHGNNPSFCKKDGPQGPTGQDGPSNCTTQQTDEHYFTFSVVDKVRIPRVPPGDYVVSFRWDCEQTPQIWSSCSDVKIVANEREGVLV